MKTNSISERPVELRTGDAFSNPDAVRTSTEPVDEYVQGFPAVSSRSIPFRGVLVAAAGDGKEIGALLRDIKKKKKQQKAKQGIVDLYNGSADEAERKRILDGLVGTLAHKRPDVRQAAAEALEEMGEGEIVDRLSIILDNEIIDSEQKENVRATLRTLGQKESARTLLDLYIEGALSIQGGSVSWYASWALSRIDDLRNTLIEEASPYELLYLTSSAHDPARGAAVRALEVVFLGEDADLFDIVDEVNSDFIYNSESGARAAYAEALGIIGRAAVKSQDDDTIKDVLYRGLNSISSALFDLMRDEDQNVVRAAYGARSGIISAMMITGKTGLLIVETNSIVRMMDKPHPGFSRSLSSLFKIASKGLVSEGYSYPFTSLTVPLKSEDKWVRRDAVELFGWLTQLLAEMDDEETVGKLREALPRTVDSLIRQMDEYDSCVTALTALHKALSTHGDDTVVTKLKGLFSKDAATPYLKKKAAAKLMIKMKVPNAEQTILQAFEHGKLKMIVENFWEALAEGYAERESVQNASSVGPFMRGDEYVFPSGTLPKKTRAIMVRASREAYPVPQPQEVSFLFDCSGSMKTKVEGDDTKNLRRFDYLKQAFSEIMGEKYEKYLPSDDSMIYKVNTFGPQDNKLKQEPGPSIEVDESGSQKEKLLAHMDKVKPGGATRIWANIGHMVDKAAEGGVIIVYSDGLSDVSAVKSKGDHEFEGHPQKFERFKNGLVNVIEAKGLKVHLISGAQEATTDLKAFSDKSENIHLSEAYNEKDIGRIMKDVATEKTLRIEEPSYGYYAFDAEGDVLFALKPIHGVGLKGKSVFPVVEGVIVDERTGEITIEDVKYRDGSGQLKELGIEAFVVSEAAQYIYPKSMAAVPVGRKLPPAITLTLDISHSMSRRAKCRKTRLDLLKKAGKALCEKLLNGGARININTFSNVEAKIELSDSSDLGEIEGAIDRMVADHGTDLRQNMLLSILATPRGGSVVTFSDGEAADLELGDEIVALAKAKGVKLHFIHCREDFDGSEIDGIKKGIKALREATEETDGTFVSFKKYRDMLDEFDRIPEILQQEHGEIEVPLPKPEAIIFHLKSEGEDIYLRHEIKEGGHE